jgi:ketosteroid isomerase-like protein
MHRAWHHAFPARRLEFSMRDRDWWLALCKAIDRKDTAAFLACLTDDCEFRFANGPAAVGHAAIAAAVDGFWASIKASEHEVLHHWGDASSAVCEGVCHYTRHDGSNVSLPFVDVLHFRGDRARQYFIYMDIAPLYAPAL